MVLGELLSESNVSQASNTMIRTVINDEVSKIPTVLSESKAINDNYSSITPTSIPLNSSKAILATSSKYILVNELTKRRNQLVLYEREDDYLTKFTKRVLIKQDILDALWYDNGKHFLILTSINIYKFDPNMKEIELIHDLIPIQNKGFKCFTLLNSSTLLITYDEWSGENIDKWQQNKDGIWNLIQRKPLKLTYNEFIGYILGIVEDNFTNLALIIYNNLYKQWRIEFRNAETLTCNKSILLAESDIAHDYRIISIKNAESDTKWLIFSSANSNIIALDSKWKKNELNYKNPVQRMGVFDENYLIVRTKERIDIHLFI